MDDGAADTAESLEMLRASARQGIALVAATPHFYPREESVEKFLRRRAESLSRLESARQQAPDGADLPPVLPGAEVLLREGLSRQDMRPMCIGGTNYLLVEPPFREPPVWLAEELEGLVFGQHLRLIWAHVDRYLEWYSAADWAELLELPDVIPQLNADVFGAPRALRAVCKRLPTVPYMALGSDMHGAVRRPTRMELAAHGLTRGAAGYRAAAVAAFEDEFIKTLGNGR